MSFEALPERLAQVRARIPQAVTIVAVTKGFGVDAVRAALAAGLADVGENRVQEALEKQDALGGEAAAARWHLIGHLQRNKARAVAGRFAVVHSVDSDALATALDRRVDARLAPLPVLLQVNVAREPQKNGCALEDAPALVRRLTSLAHLRLEGLMTIAPFTDDEDVQRRTFRGLRVLRDTLQKEEGVWLPTLSMGMSADYATAVAEGATLIRLGTALFGPRT